MATVSQQRIKVEPGKSSILHFIVLTIQEFILLQK